ncbi:hypothetical protein HQ312_14785 [Rhodococcus sp. BP-316]|uniref:hypothetical protein n=1 Tax=Rhodococcus sp. BP-316 TaxID=2739445 RepID=UPI001C9B2DA5|nr:hypothetical protein [Rhodococcus sp. BP-316]MBY6682321.1 hypothetical protein [Rhodococcus sp. BP-316]
MAADKKMYRLSPGPIADALFCLAPDRDERASQICSEMLLTLVQNDYNFSTGADDLSSPKRQLFAIRSLALGENFLGGRTDSHAGDAETTAAQFGFMLSTGSEVRGSANLKLVQMAMQGLIDPETQRGQPGSWLLRPFHESLLWYDARKSKPGTKEYSVRKVYMRGSGITVARMLAEPNVAGATSYGLSAVDAIRSALTAPSPLADVSAALEAALPPNHAWSDKPLPLENDERDAWDRGGDPRLDELASRLCKHAEGIMQQSNASSPSKLWQLRCIIALDIAIHTLRTAWNYTKAPNSERFLLLAFGSAPRAQDSVRQKSEDSYRRSRIRLSEATTQMLAERMRELKAAGVKNFGAEFRDPRLAKDEEGSVASLLRDLPIESSMSSYNKIARLAVESSNYSRASEDGFRVLIESCGMLVGTGAYRYLTASPDMMAAMVGALSLVMPVSSKSFMNLVRAEWGIVIDQEAAAQTDLLWQLDGADMARNARSADRLMNDAGLAVGLSDRTTVVGERAARKRL